MPTGYCFFVQLQNFVDALQDDDQEIRIAAAAGLAGTGDASAATKLLTLASSAQGWERFQAAKSCLVLAEQLASAGRKTEARDLYKALEARFDDHASQHDECIRNS